MITPAERRALEAVLRHGTVKAAAFSLGKSPRTVEQQLSTARQRMGVSTTVEAIGRIYVNNTDIPGR